VVAALPVIFSESAPGVGVGSFAAWCGVCGSNVREQNRMACGAVLMMLDRQQFQEIIANASRAQTRVIDACEGLESPDTY
jgi:hypothetical protein